MTVPGRFCKLTAIFCLTALLGLGAAAAPAAADNSKNVSAMLQTAVANSDEATFDTVLKLALATWPGEKEAILKAAEALKADWLSDDQKADLIAIQIAHEKAEAASRARGIYHYVDPKLWNGQAELGAGTSTGDTKEQALSLGMSFNRKFGPKWEHDLDFKFDYARSQGETTRRRFVTKYETIWRPFSHTFFINYAELELDEFAGYDYRVVENLGVGYQFLQTERQSLRLEAGPGVRFTQYALTGLTDTEFLGRLSATYNLKISEAISLKDRVASIFGTESTTLENYLQLSARINSHLAARMSFEVKYDSAAPFGTAAWDTVTRATLVYDF